MHRVDLDIVASGYSTRGTVFDAIDRATDEVLAHRKRAPFVAAARELVRRGMPLDTIIAAPGRIEPMTIGEAARWLYIETDRTMLRRKRVPLENALAGHPMQGDENDGEGAA